MTIEEAIKFAKYAQKMAREEYVREFYRHAEIALRAQQEGENPKPLTLDELRQMDGEPVWCVSMINNRSEYAILHIAEIQNMWFIAVAGASAGYGDKDTYGDTWVAYRHKPKEETT